MIFFRQPEKIPKLCQQRLEAFFHNGPVRLDEVADKYELVRQNGLKVFDRETINAHPPLRAAYLTFWNEKCLELLTKKTPKNMVEAIVKREWNLLKKD